MDLKGIDFIKFFSSKGTCAVTYYNLSHGLYLKGHKIMAHIIHNHNLRVTGADINEAAKIGERLYMPHPVGVVIGG